MDSAIIFAFEIGPTMHRFCLKLSSYKKQNTYEFDTFEMIKNIYFGKFRMLILINIFFGM